MSTVLRRRHQKELCQLQRLLLHTSPSAERVTFDGQLSCRATSPFVSNIQDGVIALLTCTSNCEAE